jgi:hypothetical protein
MDEIEIRIRDIYPNVDYVKVKYTIYYALHEVQEYEIKINNDRLVRYCCVIRCYNDFCTSNGFDLSSQVTTAIVRKEVIEGEEKCIGKLSAKYQHNPNQPCDCSIKYTMEPVFKKEINHEETT